MPSAFLAETLDASGRPLRIANYSRPWKPGTVWFVTRGGRAIDDASGRVRLFKTPECAFSAMARLAGA